MMILALISGQIGWHCGILGQKHTLRSLGFAAVNVSVGSTARLSINTVLGKCCVSFMENGETLIVHYGW